MHLEKGKDLGRVDKGKFGVLTQSCTWDWELLKRRRMLKRTGAGAGVAGVAENAVQTVEKAPIWSSPGKSNHSPLVPCVRCSWCRHLKQGHGVTAMKGPKQYVYSAKYVNIDYVSVYCVYYKIVT